VSRGLGAIAVLLLGAASIAGCAQPGVQFDMISNHDLAQLGFDLKPVPADEKPARILPAQAAEIAAMHVFGQTATEAKAAHSAPEVKRAFGHAFDDQAPRTLWVVVYPSGETDAVPWGPVGPDGILDRPTRMPTYTGILIDDQTGEVLVRFRGGTQNTEP
jgi:hypothetical protein